MVDIIVGGIIVLLVGGAVLYVVKEKKKGVRCIGCHCAGECSKSSGNSCQCQSAKTMDNE